MWRSSSLAETWGSYGREHLLYNLLRASPRVITGKRVSEPRQSARSEDSLFRAIPPVQTKEQQESQEGFAERSWMIYLLDG